MTLDVHAVVSKQEVLFGPAALEKTQRKPVGKGRDGACVLCCFAMLDLDGVAEQIDGADAYKAADADCADQRYLVGDAKGKQSINHRRLAGDHTQMRINQAESEIRN